MQVLPVLGPRLTVHPGGRIAFEREVGRLQAFGRVDMVHQRGEPATPVASPFIRIPSSALHANPGPAVRRLCASMAFPLARGLPSTASAA